MDELKLISSRNGITSLLAESQSRRRSWDLWRKKLFMYNCDSYSAAQWFGIRGPRGGGDGAGVVGRHFKGLKLRFSNKNSMSTKTITLKLKVNEYIILHKTESICLWWASCKTLKELAWWDGNSAGKVLVPHTVNSMSWTHLKVGGENRLYKFSCDSRVP